MTSTHLYQAPPSMATPSPIPIWEKTLFLFDNNNWEKKRKTQHQKPVCVHVHVRIEFLNIASFFLLFSFFLFSFLLFAVCAMGTRGRKPSPVLFF